MQLLVLFPILLVLFQFLEKAEIELLKKWVKIGRHKT